jgi:branched-chain amino acid transport system substrate-binding protein
MRKATWMAVLLAVGTIGAACGDDDDGGDAAEPVATEAPAQTAATAPAGTEAPAPDDGLTAAVDLDAALDPNLECTATNDELDPLRIGYAADFSELGGYADVPGAAAAQFMVDRINCSGGIEGAEVELTVQDIQGDPDVTQRAAQDLLDAGVSGILGPPFSDFGLPLLSVVNGAVPVVFVASTEVVLADAENSSFLAGFNDPAQATAAATFAVDQGFETAVTLSSPDAPYFETTTRVFGEVFERGGGELLGDYTFSLADTDFSSQVNEIASLPEPPDVIYTAMIMPATETLLGQLDGAGLTDTAVIGADSFDATGILAAGDLAEGVYFTTHGFPAEGSRMQAFLDAYAQIEGEELETVSFGTLAADAVLVLADAYYRAGTTDPAAIADAIRETENLELITETVTYAGTNGTPIKPVFILQVQDGAYALADSFVAEDVPEG